MADDGSDETAAALREAVQVLNGLSRTKALELNQRMLDEPSLRSSICELLIAAVGTIPSFADVVLESFERLNSSQGYLSASLRSRVVELSALVGGLSYTVGDQARSLRAICSEVLAVLGYLDGLFNAQTSEDGVDEIAVAPLGLRSVGREFKRISSSVAEFELEENRRRSAEAAKESELAAEASKRAAGTSADQALGSYYESIATREVKDAVNFRRAAISLFVVGVVVAALIAYIIVTNHEEGIGSQLFKMAACLPVLAVAFYLSHESNNHRMVARRAREVEVRLYTLEAFLAPLEPDQRASLRAKVGESLLVGPLALTPGSEKQVVDAQRILEKLLERSAS